MDCKLSVVLLLIIIGASECRRHHLQLKNDIRRFFKVSSFGFLAGGELIIDVPEFSYNPINQNAKFGITLAKTMTDSLSPYLEGQEERCLLDDDITDDEDRDVGLVFLIFDFKNEIIRLNCSQSLTKLRVMGEPETKSRSKRAPPPGNSLGDDRSAAHEKGQLSPDPVLGEADRRENPVSNVISNDRTKVNVDTAPNRVELKPKELQHKPSQAGPVNNEAALSPKSQVEPAKENKIPVAEQPSVKVDENKEEASEQIPPDDEDAMSKPNVDSSETLAQTLNIKSSCVTTSYIRMTKTKDNVYSFRFKVVIVDHSQEGLYSVFFHSCPNYLEYDSYQRLTKTNLSMFIVERNFENYLSAGEMPLPELYFALSVIFFILGFIWVQVVKSKREESFKIHYLMGSLVFVKAFALLFHGINFHSIGTQGTETETWAVLYYATHLLKGALLFMTIVLIGTGWTFVKHILSDKDKKIFMIVIPLQVLANIAEIITDESEEGEIKHKMWREIFILVDLLCCGAILFPVVWSIRHLQEASHIDGKAAINLKKLKLFRRFYIMVVCYIYFTRIIVYLLKITVPFQYEWLEVFCQHSAILVFFVLTGYHFQPAMQNPYFQLSQDDDLEMEEVLFEITPNTYTENLKKKKALRVEVEPEDDSAQLIKKRESSHDFD
ncbi:Uncharacterized protein HDE_08044 [Halotydeus destructor]|nr:Uncharacterized protein HDE_08044 [Halotydeus destructor]